MATSLPQDILAVALCVRGVLDLALPHNAEAQAILSAFRSLGGDGCPSELGIFRAELDAVMLELSQEEPEVVHSGTTAAMDVGDDVGLRENAVESLAGVAETLCKSLQPEAPVSDNALQQETPVTDSASQQETARPERRSKYPRVDPPDIEDQPGQAIREDTPGYIA